MPRRQRPPVRQVAALWFAAGLAVASFVAYFFDTRQGSTRRHMAYDRFMSTGRRMGRWSGKKARHARNKAMGTAAEIRSAAEPENVAAER